jgi:hypothetical protein
MPLAPATVAPKVAAASFRPVRLEVLPEIMLPPCFLLLLGFGNLADSDHDRKRFPKPSFPRYSRAMPTIEEESE